jgi:O-antigen/teichoic acid export membrane protein
MFKYLRQLASESLIYGLAGTLTRFITVFLVPLYTRALTPENYGVMSLVRNTTTLMGIVASLALDSAAHRFYWDTEDIEERKSTIACWTWSWLALAGAAATIVVVSAPTLAVKMTGTTQAVDALRLAAISVPFGVLGVVYANRARMQRRPWTVTIYAMVSSLVTVILSALFVLVLRQGIRGVFLAQFIVYFLTTLVLAVLLRDWIHPGLFKWNRLKKMVRYAVPLIPAVVSWWVIDVIDRYFLRVYSTTAEVGLYDIGYSIAAVVALGTAAFQQAWTPFALSIQNVADSRRVYANTLVAFTWVGSVACVGASLFAPEALRLLTTKSYYGASSVVPLLAFSYFSLGAAYITSLGVVVKKQTVSMGMAITIAAALNILLNFWLVPPYGKDGAALATLLSYAFVPVYMYYRSQKVYPIPYSFGKAGAIVLVAVAIILIGGVWTFQNVWVSVVTKLLLLSLFVPLLLAVQIVTFAQVKQFISSAIRTLEEYTAQRGIAAD